MHHLISTKRDVLFWVILLLEKSPGLLTEILKKIQAETLINATLMPSSWEKTLKSMRNDNVKISIFPHLNINSIRNKFEYYGKSKLKVVLMYLWFLKQKLTTPFLIVNSWLKVSVHLTLDCDLNRGWILLYVSKDIPSNSVILIRKNCVLLNLVQDGLLSCFWPCLHNQLTSTHSIMTY